MTSTIQANGRRPQFQLTTQLSPSLFLSFCHVSNSKMLTLLKYTLNCFKYLLFIRFLLSFPKVLSLLAILLHEVFQYDKQVKNTKVSIVKLSPSSSFSLAELALFSLSPTNPPTPRQVPIGLNKRSQSSLSLAKASLAYLRLVKPSYMLSMEDDLNLISKWKMTSTYFRI